MMTLSPVKEPRIYVYKVTFEEIPDWYWGIHKESKYGEFYLGSPTTNKWKWNFYTPELTLLQVFDYSEKGWKEAKLLENRLILPDLNNPLCLNESAGGIMSLESCREGGRKGAVTANTLKHQVKDEKGRSISVMGMNKKIHSVLNGEGKSIHGVLAANRLNLDKTPEGKSKAASKGGKTGGPIGGLTTSAQMWIDPDHPELGAQNAGNLVRMQKRRGYPCSLINRVKVS